MSDGSEASVCSAVTHMSLDLGKCDGKLAEPLEKATGVLRPCSSPCPTIPAHTYRHVRAESLHSFVLRAAGTPLC